MSKKLTVELEIVDKVEQVMLRGFGKPSQIMKLVPEISDFKVADIYISAIRNRWARNTLNLNDERFELIEQSKGAQAELEARANKADPQSNFYLGAKNSAREERRERKKLLGLEEFRFRLSKDDNPFEGLSEEERHQRILELLSDDLIKQEYAKRFGTILSERAEG